MGTLLLLAGSVLGITAMVVFNAWLRISPSARLDSLEEAMHRLDVDSVGFEAGEGVLTADGQAALIQERSGACLALLVARGSDVVIRYLTPGTVRDVETDGDDTLRLRLNDFVFAPARLQFDSAGTAAHWADALATLQPQPRSA
jgi:hypothetical protein